MLRLEAARAGQQPAGREGGGDAHAKLPRVGAGGDFLHPRREFRERRAHARREALAVLGQADAPTGALHEPRAEIGLERLELVADRAVREVERLGGLGQAAEAGRCLECPQGLHRGKADGHGILMSIILTYCTKTIRLSRAISANRLRPSMHDQEVMNMKAILSNLSPMRVRWVEALVTIAVFAWFGAALIVMAGEWQAAIALA